jgi:hypothetical protein
VSNTVYSKAALARSLGVNDDAILQLYIDYLEDPNAEMVLSYLDPEDQDEGDDPMSMSWIAVEDEVERIVTKYGIDRH